MIQLKGFHYAKLAFIIIVYNSVNGEMGKLHLHMFLKLALLCLFASFLVLFCPLIVIMCH